MEDGGESGQEAGDLMGAFAAIAVSEGQTQGCHPEQERREKGSWRRCLEDMGREWCWDVDMLVSEAE